MHYTRNKRLIKAYIEPRHPYGGFGRAGEKPRRLLVRCGFRTSRKIKRGAKFHVHLMMVG